MDRHIRLLYRPSAPPRIIPVVLPVNFSPRTTTGRGCSGTGPDGNVPKRTYFHQQYHFRKPEMENISKNKDNLYVRWHSPKISRYPKCLCWLNRHTPASARYHRHGSAVTALSGLRDAGLHPFSSQIILSSEKKSVLEWW